MKFEVNIKIELEYKDKAIKTTMQELDMTIEQVKSNIAKFYTNKLGLDNSNTLKNSIDVKVTQK